MNIHCFTIRAKSSVRSTAAARIHEKTGHTTLLLLQQPSELATDPLYNKLRHGSTRINIRGQKRLRP